jgi:hypothetical protein
MSQVEIRKAIARTGTIIKEVVISRGVQDVEAYRVRYIFNNEFKYVTITAKTYDNILVQNRATEQKSAIKGRYVQLEILPITVQETKDASFFVESTTPIATAFLAKQIKTLNGIRSNMTIMVLFESIEYTGSKASSNKSEITFMAKNQALTHESDIKLYLESSIAEINIRMQEFEGKGSGVKMGVITKLLYDVVAYKPIIGSSYFQTPRFLESKGIINMKNEDQECFKWCILRAIHPTPVHPERIDKKLKAKADSLKFTDISFPMKICNISKFEMLNNISINVLQYEPKFNSQTNKMDHEILPLYRTKCGVKSTHVNLLLISKDLNSHYVLIKDMSRLLAHLSNNNEARYFCFNCLHGCSSQAILDRHIEDGCHDSAPAKLKLPEEEKAHIKFKNYKNKLMVPFVIYADFECLTTQIQGCPTDSEESYTNKYQKHEPCGYSYKVVSAYEQFTKPLKLYRGDDTAQKFLEALIKEQNSIIKKIKKSKYIDISNMIITDAQMKEYACATHCHVCEKVLGKDKVCDHDHITGLYRGAAHNACNINYSYKNVFIPVILHNLKGYDSHLIIQALNKQYNNIKCIPNNTEKYISFSIGKLRFIDSFAFLASGLDKLVCNLAAQGDKTVFKHMLSEFSTSSEDQLKLLLKKGTYPYDYMNSFDRFNETNLPDKADFFSILTNSNISDQEYEHAKNVWNSFKCDTLGKYHDLYLKTDVLLLADVFENFRMISQANYKLDPCHYLTLPGFAWDAMLYKTDVKMSVFNNTQLDMHLFTEKGLRGGICLISNRYARANNKYISSYNPDEKSSYIMYLDANNLYGYAMIQSLPIDDFKWADPSIFTADYITNISDDSDTGCLLEVDLEYPKEIHDLHNDYPCAPESLAVTDNMLSEYSKQLKSKLSLGTSNIKKLVPNLNNKSKYVLHYRNLKLYISLGLVLKKVYRVLQFRQEAWLKPYIDFNTTKRAASKNDFEKEFFKLMNNSVFGKTMENVKGRINFELVTDEKRLEKLTAKPRYKKTKRFNDDLVGVELNKSAITLNKPIIVGACVLDMSKVLMYDFHYNTMKKTYGNKCKLLFTDTDSLTYHIETEDIYNDMSNNKHDYDFSDYPKEHMLYNCNNKKVIGKMKDETNGVPIVEFVGLKPKMYSVKTEFTESKKAKGVSRHVVKNDIKHSDYYNCLMNDSIKMTTMNTIRSYDHHIYSINVNKRGLSSYDDKSYHLNNLTCLRHGHYKINEMQ